MVDKYHLVHETRSTELETNDKTYKCGARDLGSLLQTYIGAAARAIDRRSRSVSLSGSGTVVQSIVSTSMEQDSLELGFCLQNQGANAAVRRSPKNRDRVADMSCY